MSSKIGEQLEETEKIFVVDPDDMPEGPSEEELDMLEYADSFLVGGSKNVTEHETLKNGKVLKERFPEKPVRQEPSRPDQVSGETISLFDGVVVSTVLNGSLENLIGKHLDFFQTVDQKYHEELPGSEKEVDSFIDQTLEDMLIPQAYIVQNPYCDAADESGVTEEDLWNEEGMKAGARYTEHFLDTPIFYIEYSGEYGGPEIVESAASVLEDTHLRYGGGIETYDQVEEILDAGADSVVVGTSFENGRNPFNPEN